MTTKKLALFSSPTPYSTFIPPLFSLLPEVVKPPGLPVPLDPVRHLPLRGELAALAPVAPVALEEALLERVAVGGLLADGLPEALVQAGGGKGREGVVHVRLAGAPLALEGVGREQLGLGGGALVREAGLVVGKAGGQVGVFGQRGAEGVVRGRQGGVGGAGGVGQGLEEGGRGEDVGYVLFSATVVSLPRGLLFSATGFLSPRKRVVVVMMMTGRGAGGGEGAILRFVLQHGRQPAASWVGRDVLDPRGCDAARHIVLRPVARLGTARADGRAYATDLVAARFRGRQRGRRHRARDLGCVRRHDSLSSSLSLSIPISILSLPLSQKVSPSCLFLRALGSELRYGSGRGTSRGRESVGRS